jgi:uncharacterized membrane-anchored protein
MTSVDQIVGRVPLPVRVGVAALVLCGLILAMVIERASILRNGATVKLATTPVDPRDLFRGDYVILTYEISSINQTRLGLVSDITPGEIIHVGVKAGANGRADVVGLARKDQPREAGLVWLQATAFGSTRCNTTRAGDNCSERDSILRVTYGLESFFVPEGQGKAIETTPSSRVEVIAAVSTSGKAAIKSLLIDGKPVYDEPPY